jgi:diacylglycerol kinase family enzyme
MPARPPLPVIVNAAGGTARRMKSGLADQIEGAFAAARRAIELELVDGDGLRAALQRHAGAPRIAVGGGDGTLGTAAATVSQHHGELAILPLGTRNHFAGQLGIPSDLAGAAALAAGGKTRAVDLGQAADRTFVNNLSAGAYVDLVREREASRLPKLLATIPASWRTLRNLRSRPFDLTVDGRRVGVATPLLFIGNNRYEVAEGRPVERAAMDDGVLAIYAVAPLSRASLIAAALRTLAGRARMHRDFAIDCTAREVRIVGPGTTLDVAIDGERCSFDLPVTVRILPRALAVVAPESN